MSKGRDLNACSFTGLLGASPEITHLESGQTVARFNLASHDYRRDEREESGYRQETSWIPLIAFGRLAERAERDGLAKGVLVAVQGRLRVYKYLDQSQVTRTGFEIYLNDYTLLADPKSNGERERERGTKPLSQPQPTLTLTLEAQAQNEAEAEAETENALIA